MASIPDDGTYERMALAIKEACDSYWVAGYSIDEDIRLLHELERAVAAGLNHLMGARADAGGRVMAKRVGITARES